MRLCSHVLEPSHCQHWLFRRLCGHFARFFLTASLLALLRPLLHACCSRASRVVVFLEQATFSLLHSLHVAQVWRNCYIFNGPDNAIYKRAQALAELFDSRFSAQISPPSHYTLLPALPFGDPAWLDRRVTLSSSKAVVNQ